MATSPQALRWLNPARTVSLVEGRARFSETRAGWTAGGGVEWMFAQNWSAKVEYLHYDLGTGNFSWAALGAPTSTFFSGVVYQTETTSVHFRGDIVRAGLNYKF